MLTFNLVATDEYPEVYVELEHSLHAISKWEEIHEVPFYKKDDERPPELVLDYIRCMVVGHLPPDFLLRLSPEQVKAAYEYTAAKRSASWFREDPHQRPNREIITSELVYTWMTELRIPWEAQYWHFSRLMNVVKMLTARQSEPKKMSRSAQAEQIRRLNAERQARLGTTG